MTGSSSGKISSHNPALYVHCGEVMDTGKTLIAFRVPSPTSKRRLAEIAEEQGESVSEFIRTAIAERTQRLAAQWVPTGDPTVDRRRMQ